ncbi:MAG: AAA family ATPase [bacterium]|nr:AAA family ATPase [bacterium]MDY4100613.1 AAA family ATPase [Lachnospiraceae bacterium]
MLFERKIYAKLLEWKQTAAGEKALLIEGARRIGKSTIAEEFGKNEYKSYLLIDFNDVSDAVLDAFQNYLNDLDTFFMILSTEMRVQLYPRESLIIFDEIQRFPKARQSIKKLVKDGRFDYIETGSLISVKESVKDITIPSEERKLKMYPMDFEEFCMALGEGQMVQYIKNCFEKQMPMEEKLHHKAMLLFRQFIIVGGMPQSVAAYVNNAKSFQKSDQEKRDILSLYRDDIMKIDNRYQSKVLAIFDQIPAFLSKHEKRVILSEIEKQSTLEKFHDTFFWLSDSMIANECFNCKDPNVGLSLNEDRTYVKCYMGDTGLLISHSFDENEIVEEDLYRMLLLGRLSVNEGMFFENAIAQELTSKGHKLFFYTRYNEEKHRNDIEIDFLIANKSKTRYRVSPIEVKSTDRYSITSLERFIDRYRERIGKAYVIHTKNLKVTDDILYLPAYMVMCL